MGESTSSQSENSPGVSAPENSTVRKIQLLHGPIATDLQAHSAGVAIGIAGLVIGALAASPLLAVAGLVGGVAAGTMFFDRRAKQGNLHAFTAAANLPAQSEPADSSAEINDAKALSAADAAACGPDFSDPGAPFTPTAPGNRPRSGRVIR